MENDEIRISVGGLDAARGRERSRLQSNDTECWTVTDLHALPLIECVAPGGSDQLSPAR